MRIKRKTRTNLRFWQLLSIWLVMSIGFGAYQSFRSRQDARIEQRQSTAWGVVYATTNGKNPTASYSFKYEGKEYRGSQSFSSIGLPGAEVSIFFDPQDPTKNSLTEYGRKTSEDRSLAAACGYAACGLTGALVLVFLAGYGPIT
jgi:hypothetical protein